MYRANKNNQELDERLEEPRKELEENNREKLTIIRIMKKVRLVIVGLILIGVGMILMIKKLGIEQNLININNDKLEIVEDKEVFSKQNLEEKKEQIKLSEDNILALKEELFQIDLYGLVEQSEFEDYQEVVINFEPRMVGFEGLEKEGKREIGIKEEKMGQLVLSWKNETISNHLGSLIWKAIGEGNTEILIGQRKIEVMITEGFINEEIKEASCTANNLKIISEVEAQSGPNMGQIRIKWQGGGEKTYVKYGFKPGDYFLASEVKNKKEMVLENLEAGKKYYLRLENRDSCGNINWTEEISARAGYGGMTRESIENYEGILPVAEALIP